MKKLWTQPWAYKESFLIAFILLILGFLTEIITAHRGIQLPPFPYNLYIGLSFLVYLAFLYIFYRSHPIVKWLGSIPAAISSISLVTFMALMLGVFTQDDPSKEGFFASIGLTYVKNSWPMVFSQIYVLSSLGLVILRRLRPFTRKNFGFLLNHFGLWLVIAAASLGTADLERYRMQLPKGEIIWYGFDNEQRPVELPFALRLDDFTIEEYPPKMGLYDATTGEIIKDGKKPQMVTIDPDQSPFFLQNWEVSINDYLTSAEKTEDGFIYSEEVGSPPAAIISANNLLTKETVSGWISCGSFTTEGEYLWLSPTNVLVMTIPEASRYLSNVTVYTRGNDPFSAEIEVNKAPKVEGWRLYQLSYDQNKGKWSDVSVIEAVRDPWLPVVFAGIFLLLAGALYILWIGKDIKE